MKKIFFILSVLVFSIEMIAQTPVPGGNVSGTWTQSGSPYQVMGDITIQDGQTLILESGVEVRFQGNYSLTVYGRILANGTETDSVIFTAENPSIGFNSILFNETPSSNDSSVFEYCQLKYGIAHSSVWPSNGGGAVKIKGFSKIRFDHCYFYHNRALDNLPAGYPAGGALGMLGSNILIQNCSFSENESYFGGAVEIYLYSNPVIRNCRFENNQATEYGGAISINDASSPQIVDNEFIGNSTDSYGGAILIGPGSIFIDPSNPVIERNLFFGNQAGMDGGALEIIAPSDAIIKNNSILSNQAIHGGGIDISNLASPSVTNTILRGNTAMEGNQVYIWSEFASPGFYYSDIEGDSSAFGGATFTGEYIFNIDEDPLFCDTAEAVYDFHLQDSSPCIETGDSSCMLYSGKRCDIGAYIYLPNYCFNLVNKELRIKNKELRIMNFPNPIIETTTLSYILKESGFVKLEIFNSFGQLVAKPVNGYQAKDEQSIQWNAENLPAGIYFYRVQAGREVGSGKMVKY